jgi:hypothetical protein
VRWNGALHGGQVLKPEGYTAMTTPRPLVDGTQLTYAMGLSVDDRAGHRMISHGGGINGYVSDGRYFPDDGLIIIVLQNSTGPQGAGTLAEAFTNLILGPVPQATAVPFTGNLDALTGEYAGPARGTHLHMTVSRDGDALLVATRGQPTPTRPVHIGNGTWTNNSGTEVTFVVHGERATEMRLRQGGGYYVLRRAR